MRNAAETLIAVSLFPCPGLGQQPTTPSVPTGSESPVSFHATISNQEKQHILDGRCNVLTFTSSMPKSLKDGFAEVAGRGTFEHADPNKQFQETDVRTTRRLPSRRLVLAVSCEDSWFVHYEHGGIGISYQVMIFRPGSNGVLQFQWGGSGFYRAKSIDELRLAISSGKFADDLKFYW
jgi:hypothetical protein